MKVIFLIRPIFNDIMIFIHKRIKNSNVKSMCAAFYMCVLVVSWVGSPY